jgi:hypothetical protein
MCSVWDYVTLCSALLPPYKTMIKLIYENKAEFFLTKKIIFQKELQPDYLMDQTGGRLKEQYPCRIRV